MPRRKPASSRLNRETRDIGLARRTVGAVPAAPRPGGREMLVDVRKSWERFWLSDVSGLVVDADRGALDRLFGLYDLRERMVRQVIRQPYVAGAAGQQRLNPAAGEVGSLDGRILALEDRFGITPMARLKLGITLGVAAKSMDEMNAAFLEDDDDDDDTGKVEDPRLYAIDTTASSA